MLRSGLEAAAVSVGVVALALHVLDSGVKTGHFSLGWHFGLVRVHRDWGERLLDLA